MKGEIPLLCRGEGKFFTKQKNVTFAVKDLTVMTLAEGSMLGDIIFNMQFH